MGSRFRRERLKSPKEFDRRSFRIVVQGDHRVVVGCPKGQYDVEAKVCRVGTEAQAVLHPVREANPCAFVPRGSTKSGSPGGAPLSRPPPSSPPPTRPKNPLLPF